MSTVRLVQLQLTAARAEGHLVAACSDQEQLSCEAIHHRALLLESAYTKEGRHIAVGQDRCLKDPGFAVDAKPAGDAVPCLISALANSSDTERGCEWSEFRFWLSCHACLGLKSQQPSVSDQIIVGARINQEPFT